MRFAQENSFAPLKRFFPLFYFLQIYDKSGALPKNELLYFFVFLPPLAMKQATAQRMRLE